MFTRSGESLTSSIFQRLDTPETLLRSTADCSMLLQALLDVVVDEILELTEEFRRELDVLEGRALVSPSSPNSSFSTRPDCLVFSLPAGQPRYVGRPPSPRAIRTASDAETNPQSPPRDDALAQTRRREKNDRSTSLRVWELGIGLDSFGRRTSWLPVSRGQALSHGCEW